MPEIRNSFGDTRAGRIMRAIGAIIIGAYAGAIVGTPAIKDFTSLPDVGWFTLIDAVIGAFLFLTGMRLLQSNAPRGQIWLGGVFVGGVVGAYIGAMFPVIGPLIMGVVIALLFGSFVIWTPWREDPRAGLLWGVASALLVGTFFFALASLFPVVQQHHATGYMVSLIVVCVPASIMGVIGGCIFARQTGSRKLLTLGATVLVVFVAMVPYTLYHVPLRTISFPADRAVGTIRFSDLIEFGGHPAQGDVKVPLRGVIYLQLNADAGDDLSFLEKMPGLKELDMTGSTADDAAVQAVGSLTELTFLSLADTQVTDAALPALGGLTKLERLELSGTRVSGSGLEHLANLTKLQVLGLGRTEVDDESMARLAQLPALREVNLYMTSVTDAGLAQLGDAPQLQKLDLYMTDVTDAGVAAFLEKKPGAEVLH